MPKRSLVGRAFVPRVWHWLTEPPPVITEDFARRRVRLLLSILTVLFLIFAFLMAVSPVLTLAIGQPGSRSFNRAALQVAMAAALATVLVAFILARRGKIGLSAIAIIGMNVLTIFVNLSLGMGTQHFAFLAIGVILASMLLSYRYTLAVWGAVMAATLGFGLADHRYPLWATFLAMIFLFFVGALSVTAALLHDRDIEEIQTQARKMRKATARLLEAKKAESIARLSAGIAHEFNNIMAGIVGSAEVIARSRAADPGHQARLIKQAALRASELTDKLLSYSRQQLLHPRTIDLGRLVRSMEPALKGFLSPTTLAVRLSPSVNRVYADPDAVESIIESLVRHSDKYLRMHMTALPPTISIETDGDSQSGRWPKSDGRPTSYVTIVIADNGTPLPEEVLSSLFEPFYTEGEFGTGDLELAAAQGIVHQSGGRLVVKSSAEHGNRFLLALPRANDFTSERSDGVTVDETNSRD